MHACLPVRPGIEVVVEVACFDAAAREAALGFLTLAWETLPGALRLSTPALAGLRTDRLAPWRVADRLALRAVTMVAVHRRAHDGALRRITLLTARRHIDRWARSLALRWGADWLTGLIALGSAAGPPALRVAAPALVRRAFAAVASAFGVLVHLHSLSW